MRAGLEGVVPVDAVGGKSGAFAFHPTGKDIPAGTPVFAQDYTLCWRGMGVLLGPRLRGETGRSRFGVRAKSRSFASLRMTTFVCWDGLVRTSANERAGNLVGKRKG